MQLLRKHTWGPLHHKSSVGFYNSCPEFLDANIPIFASPSSSLHKVHRYTKFIVTQVHRYTSPSLHEHNTCKSPESRGKKKLLFLRGTSKSSQAHHRNKHLRLTYIQYALRVRPKTESEPRPACAAIHSLGASGSSTHTRR